MTPSTAIDTAIRILSDVEHSRVAARELATEYRDCAHSLDVLLCNSMSAASVAAVCSPTVGEWLATQELTASLVTRSPQTKLLFATLNRLRKSTVKSTNRKSR